MNVELISHTGYPDPWHAADVMIFTKQTRLKLTPNLFNEIKNWPTEKKLEELNYMAQTVPSSWEFADFTFLIEGVTRAFTHQLVRTRTASYAQQAMRVVNMEGWEYMTGPTIQKNELARNIYDECMGDIDDAYKALLDLGIPAEDARGLLPTNIFTNIVMKNNLRGMADLIRKRSSSRVQGEYRDVLKAMKQAMLDAQPWVHIFIETDFNRAAYNLDVFVQSLGLQKEQENNLIKQIDIMRNQC